MLEFIRDPNVDFCLLTRKKFFLVTDMNHYKGGYCLNFFDNVAGSKQVSSNLSSLVFPSVLKPFLLSVFRVPSRLIIDHQDDR